MSGTRITKAELQAENEQLRARWAEAEAALAVRREEAEPFGPRTGAADELDLLSRELQAANEELSALNEELHSANEELRTTNEELAAANEELHASGEELRVVHEALAESEEMYRSLVEQIPFGMWMTDHEGKPTYQSPMLLEVMGLAGQPLDHRAYLELIHPDDRARWRLEGERAVQDRTEYRLEYRVRGADGLYRHLLALGIPRFGGKGVFLGHIGLDLDITDRKLQEERIEALAEDARMTAERLQVVFDSLHDPLIVHAATGGRMLFNPAASEWLVTAEGTAEEAYAASRVRYPDGTEMPPEQTAIARLLRGETLHEEAMLSDSKLGPDRHIVLSGSPLRSNGSVTGAVVTWHDVTELMDAQEQRDAMILTQARETAFMHLLTEAPDTQSLVQQVGDLLCEWFDCDAFAVRWRRGEDFPYLAHGGLSEDLLTAEASLCRRDEHGQVVCGADGKTELECLCGAVLRGHTDPSLPCYSLGGSLWTNDITKLIATTPEEQLPSRIRGLCVDEGFRSIARIPLRFQDNVYGLLQIDSKQPGRFSPEDIQFLERMGRSLALRLAQHETREALADSEGRYRTIGELLPYGTFVTAPDGIPMYLSPSFLRLIGKDLQDIRQLEAWRALEHPDDAPETYRRWLEAIANRSYLSCEHRMLGQDGQYHWILSRGVPVLDDDGEIEYWLGVNIDIGELKQAEEALRRSEQRLRRAQEIAHLGSWELDLVHDELTWSDEAYRIFGLEPQEFGATYEAFLDRVHPDDRPAVHEAYFGSIREGRDRYEIEHRVVQAHTGAVRVVHERCEHFRNEAGEIVRSVGMVHDITDRQAAEARIAHLASFPEMNPYPVFEVNRQGESLYQNPAARALLAEGGLAAWLPEDFPRVAGDLLRTGAIRFREVQVDEEAFLTCVCPVPAFETVRVYAVSITELKRAEQERERLLAQVQQQATELETIINSIADGVSINDAAGKLVRCNPAAERILRYGDYRDLSQHERQQRARYLRPDGTEFAYEDLPLSRSLRGETVVSELIQLVWPDGSGTWVTSSTAPLYDAEGTLLGVVLTNTDMTELRRGEAEREKLLVQVQESYEDLAVTNEELHTANEELQAAHQALAREQTLVEAVIDNFPGAFIAATPPGLNLIRANRYYLEFSGGEVQPGTDPSTRPLYTLYDLDGRALSPDEWPLMRSLRGGEIVEGEEYRRRRHDDTLVPVRIYSGPVRNSEGEIIAAVLSFFDISKEKEAEAERERLLTQVQAERQRLFSVLSIFPAYVCLLTPDHECAFANKRFTELFGEGQPGQKCHHLLFGRDEPCEDCQSFNCLKDSQPRVWEWTSPMDTIFEVYDYPFIDTDGTCLVLEIGFEITERKRAQEELQAHRERLEELVRERTAEVAEGARTLESVFNNSLSCLVLLDTEFNFIRINDAYAVACARPVEDFAGHNYFVDYPSAELPATFAAVVRTRQPWSMNARPFVNRDHPEWGMDYWDLSLVPILNAAGETEMLLLSLQDVTERERASQQLRKYQESLRSLAMELTRTEEQQRRRIATVIHDDVTQNLAFAKMKTALIRRSEDVATVRRELGPLEAALDEAIQNARNLTFEVSPPILYEIGFQPALKWLVEQMSERHGYQARLQADQEEQPLSEDVQVTLFQAVRELLTNVAKHARAKQVTVAVQREGDFVQVVVSDDGVGFTDTGERLGFGLFNIQERLSYLGGELEVEGRPGQGARFTLRAPLQEG
jgi:PAS domain S-box-containing protein